MRSLGPLSSIMSIGWRNGCGDERPPKLGCDRSRSFETGPAVWAGVEGDVKSESYRILRL